MADSSFFAQASNRLHQAIYDYGWHDEQHRHVPGECSFKERASFHAKADSLAKLLFDCTLAEYFKKHAHSRTFYMDGVQAYKKFSEHYIDKPLNEGFDYEAIGHEI